MYHKKLLKTIISYALLLSLSIALSGCTRTIDSSNTPVSNKPSTIGASDLPSTMPESGSTTPGAATENPGAINKPADPTTGTVDNKTISTALTSIDSALVPLFEKEGAPSPDKIKAIIEKTPGVNLLMAEEGGALAEIGKDGPLMFISSGQPEGFFETNSDAALPPQGNASPMNNKDLQINLLYEPNAKSNAQSSRPSLIPLTAQGEIPYVSLPKGSNVLLLNGLGGEVYKDVTPDIRNLFRNSYSCDYSVTVKEATLDSLRAAKDVDVLFIKSHGEKTSFVWPDQSVNGLSTFCLSSSTRVNLKDPSPSHLSSDLLKRHIVYMFEPTTSAEHQEWLYGITFGFVDANWRLNPGGFAFICACSSASPEAAGFRGSVLQSGASVYAGWTEKVDTNFADDRAKYVFDRLLGVNSFKKPSPYQRSFTYREINEELIRRNMVTWPGTKEFVPSTLKFVESTSDNNFGLLAPSIKELVIDEKTDSNEKPVLTINGTFGNKEGRVLLIKDSSTDELPVKVWKANKITCEIDPDDAGDIAVEVDKKRSNERRITKWKGTVTFTVIPKVPAGDCTLEDKITWDLKFRADVASFRERPGEDPKEREVDFEVTKKSETEFSSSGSWSISNEGQTVTILKWEGGGKAGVNKDTQVDGDFDYSRCYLRVNTDLSAQPYIKANLWFLGKMASKIVTFNPGLPGQKIMKTRASSIHKECYHESNTMTAEYFLHLPLDRNWNIQAGSKTAKLRELDGATPEVQLKMEWKNMSVEYPPVDDKDHGR